MYGSFLPLPKPRRFVPWNAIGYMVLWFVMCLPSVVLPFGWWLAIVWTLCGVLALAPWLTWRVLGRHNL